MSDQALPAELAGTIAIGELPVARVGFGGLRLAATDPQASARLLRRALELGVTLIDTADVYGGGESERRIADALHPYPDGVVIATKGGQVLEDGRPRADGRPDHIRRACEASLERLRLEAIPLYQLHNPDPNVPLEESLGALADLKREGKVLEMGVSNLFRRHLDSALANFPIASVQNQLSITKRGSEPELEACERLGIAFLAYRPLDMGVLAGGGGELDAVAREHGVTAGQVALAWLLQRSNNLVAIPGTTSVENLEQNVAAAQLRLGDDELRRLAPGDDEEAQASA